MKYVGFWTSVGLHHFVIYIFLLDYRCLYIIYSSLQVLLILQIVVSLFSIIRLPSCVSLHCHVIESPLLMPVFIRGVPTPLQLNPLDHDHYKAYLFGPCKGPPIPKLGLRLMVHGSVLISLHHVYINIGNTNIGFVIVWTYPDSLLIWVPRHVSILIFVVWSSGRGPGFATLRALAASLLRRWLTLQLVDPGAAWSCNDLQCCSQAIDAHATACSAAAWHCTATTPRYHLTCKRNAMRVRHPPQRCCQVLATLPPSHTTPCNVVLMFYKRGAQ